MIITTALVTSLLFNLTQGLEKGFETGGEKTIVTLENKELPFKD